MRNTFILVLIFFLRFFPGVAQVNLDSLEAATENLSQDSSGLVYLQIQSEKLRLTDQAASIWLAEKAVEFAQAIGKPFSLAESNFSAGVRNTAVGNYVRASEYLVEAEKIAEANNLQATLMKVFNSLGNLYSMQQQQSTGIVYYKKAAAICEKLNRKTDAAVIIGNIGNIYYFRTETDKRYLDSALQCFKQALAIQRTAKDTVRVIGMLNNLGLVYCDMENYEAALAALDSSSKLIEQSGDHLDLLYNLQYRGRIEFEKGNFEKAIDLYKKSLEISVEMKEVTFIDENHFALSNAYAALKDYEKAYFHFKTYKELNDSLVNSENFEKIAGMQNQYEQDKKLKEIEILKVNANRNKILIYASAGGLILLLLLAALLLNRNKMKSRINKMLEKQNDVISQKNKDITDSINYAKKIQDAMLPDEKVFSGIFPESFILFLPRDIVSGDFYWAAEKNGLKFIAVADCTGHGVPGSLMSMIGNGLLNQLILEKNLTEPAEILERMRAEIIRTLKQNESNAGAKDGMDISLCVISEQNGKHKIVFAGANNSIYILRNKKLAEYRANRFPVGISGGELNSFTSEEMEIEKNDQLYLFTDGYADQFGGEKGKKFKYRQLQEKLQEFSVQPPQMQKLSLEKVFAEWKGNLEQVDDVCIVGIKI